jgi:hypothetical protein
MGPLLDVACDRLAFVLRRLFELALVRRRDEEAQLAEANESGGSLSVPTAFQTTLRRSHDRFVADLATRCKVHAPRHTPRIITLHLASAQGGGWGARQPPLHASQRRVSPNYHA